MSIVVNGKNQAIRQPDSFRFDPIRGWQTVIRYRGTKAKVMELVPELATAGCSIDISSNSGAVWELQASSPQALDGSAEVPVNMWESASSIASKDLSDSPEFSGVSETDLGRITKWLQSHGDDGAEPTSPALTGDALTLLRLKKRGIPHEVYQPILRHTQIVSARYGTQTAYSNVGRIFSTPTGAPGDFLTALPSSGASTRPAINGSGTGFIFGWKKKPPQVQTAAYNKRQVIQEWEFGEFNVKQFGALV